MTPRGKSRLLVVALLLSLALVGGAVGSIAHARWRRSHPRVFQVSYRALVDLEPDDTPSWHRIDFVGTDHLLLTLQPSPPGENTAFHSQVWSVETGSKRIIDGLLLHRLDSTYALVWGSKRSPLVNLMSGAETPLAFATDDRCGLSAAGDVIAIVDSSQTGVEIRSTRDGSVVQKQSLPKLKTLPPPDDSPPWLRLAPGGERLAVFHFGTNEIVVCDLVTGAWSPVGEGTFIGFAPSGVVYETLINHQSTIGPVVLVTPKGERRALTAEVEVIAHALSASGESFAVAQRQAGDQSAEVVVQKVATGEVVRRIPLRDDVTNLCLALSPGGERVAIAYDDGRVEVWELP